MERNTPPDRAPGARREARWLAALAGLFAVGGGLAAWLALRDAAVVADGSRAVDPAPVRAPGAVHGPALAASGRAAGAAPTAVHGNDGPDDGPDDSGATPAGPTPVPAPGNPPLRVTVRDTVGPVEGAVVTWQRIGGVDAAGVFSDFGEFMTPPAAEPVRQRVGDVPADVADTAVRTDATGVASRDVAPGLYRLRVSRDDGDGRRVGVRDVLVRDAFPVDDEVTLERGMLVEGVVVDRDGRPVEGAKVQTWLASDPQATRASARVTTGADGRFALVGFAREPHVVAVFGSVDSFFSDSETLEPPDLTPQTEGTVQTVPVGGLTDVRIVVTRVLPTVVELRDVAGTGYGVNDLQPGAIEPGVWLASGAWGTGSAGEANPRALYVKVADGTGCPWYLGRPAGRAPFVVARRPGGLRVVSAMPARKVAGTLAPAAFARHVRAFVRTPTGDRVEFAVALVDDDRAFSFDESPSDAFDLAAFEQSTRVGPWVEVHAGTEPISGLRVPVNPDAAPRAPDATR